MLSRLSVDSSVVGERCVVNPLHERSSADSSGTSVTQTLSDGLRSVVMASAGRKLPIPWPRRGLNFLQLAQCSTSLRN